jgi:carboxyl-terminal processing protease
VRRLTPLVLAGVLASAHAVTAQAPKALETFDAAWRIVKDTHFDASMNGVDWDAVRDELRPRVGGTRNDGELRALIRDMLGRLGQSHFALIPSSPDTPKENADLSGDPGFDFRLSGRDALVTAVDPLGSAAPAGVKPGWKLIAIEGQPVASLLERLPATTSERLFLVEGWKLIETRLRGPRGSSASLTFEDGAARPAAVQLYRRGEQGLPVTVGSLPTMHVRVESEGRRTPAGATVGLVRFNVWMPAVDAQFEQAVDRYRSAGAMVIDLRGNPGGLAAMLMGISGHFMKERTSLGVMKTRDNELRFFSNPRLVNGAGQRVEPFAGPLAILVDSLSGSASECFTGGMQSLGRARVFGEITMGQALPALFDKLPNDDVLIHAYGDFVTANGTRLEGRGVVPDEIVPLRREDLLAGRDAALDRALAWIDRALARAVAKTPGQSAVEGPAAAVAPGRTGLVNSTDLRPAVFPANLIGHKSGE